MTAFFVGAAMERPFNPGDVVQLNNGGPWMIVTGYRKTGCVETVYVESDRETCDSFHPRRLRLILEACSKARTQ